MAGVKGAGGPPPKRSEQRRRTNTPAAGEPVRAPGRPAEAPEPDEGWHPIARRWFESLGRSGQSVFYQESDWLTAFAVAESMSREFKPQPLVVGKGEHAEVEMVELPPKASALTAWLKGAAQLLATEGDRRRAALELQRPEGGEEASGDVTWIDDARQRLHGAG